MNREELRRLAYQRIAWMDANLAGHHVTDEQQSYYRLVAAIYHANLRRYYDAFGWTPIDENDAFDGKYELGWGELTAFERHTISLINNDIARKEQEDERRRYLQRPDPRIHTGSPVAP